MAEVTPDQFRRMEDLFARVEGLPEDRIDAVLDLLCPDDKDIRDQVARMARGEEQAAQVVQVMQGAAQAMHEALAPGDLVGTTIGKYKILSRLGQGGFGVVYLALQTRPVERHVAFKVVLPGMNSQEVIARFEQERQALAIMNHDNVARILDGGVTPARLGSRPYFVMPYIKGDPITTYCDTNTKTIRERLDLFLQVCDGVQHAHTKGIIHRDLSPSNVLVSAGDAGESSKETSSPKAIVIDFGVARALNTRLTRKAPHTEHGDFIGKPEYMSPEQAEMGVTDIDTRTDVYSLGVLLHQLLAGILPFNSQSLPDKSPGAIRLAIRTEEPPTPSRQLRHLADELPATATTVGPIEGPSPRPPHTIEHIASRRGTTPSALLRTLRKELEWIPVRAMQKDRDKRYQSAAALADDVRNYLQGRPLSAGPQSFWYRVGKEVLAHRRLVLAASLLLFSICAGAIVSTVFAAREREQRLVATAVQDFMTDDLISGSDPEADIGPDLRISDILKAAEVSVQSRFKGRPAVQAGVELALGKSFLRIGDDASARVHLQQAASMYTTEAPDSEKRLDAQLGLGEILWRMEDPKAAIQLLEQVVAEAPRVFGPDHRRTIDSRHILAGAYKHAGAFDDAERLYRQVLAQRIRLLGPDDPDTWIVHFNLALLTDQRARKEKKARLPSWNVTMGQALDQMNHVATRLARLDSEAVIPTLKRRYQFWALAARAEAGAILSRSDDRTNDAISALEQVLPALRTRFGPRHLRVLEVEANLGRSLTTAQRAADAAPHLLAAVEGLWLRQAYTPSPGIVDNRIDKSASWLNECLEKGGFDAIKKDTERCKRLRTIASSLQQLFRENSRPADEAIWRRWSEAP